MFLSPNQNMNEWQKLGSGEGGVNDRNWVVDARSSKRAQ